MFVDSFLFLFINIYFIDIYSFVNIPFFVRHGELWMIFCWVAVLIIILVLFFYLWVIKQEFVEFKIQKHAQIMQPLPITHNIFPTLTHTHTFGILLFFSCSPLFYFLTINSPILIL